MLYIHDLTSWKLRLDWGQENNLTPNTGEVFGRVLSLRPGSMCIRSHATYVTTDWPNWSHDLLFAEAPIVKKMVAQSESREPKSELKVKQGHRIQAPEYYLLFKEYLSDDVGHLLTFGFSVRRN